MSLELKIEKTNIPENLKIEKEKRGEDIWYKFSEPMFLPYDKNLISKVEKGVEISVPYFVNVLKSFFEDTMPEIFPKDFYDKIEGDSNLHKGVLNPEKNDNFQYAFNLDFCRNEFKRKEDLPKQYENMHIKTSIFLESEIFHPGANDIIDNGFFPRIKNGNIQPVQGIEIRTTYTFLELPKILSGENNVCLSKLSTPILQTLLNENPLFFPENKYIASRDIGDYFFGCPAISLKNSEIKTISQASKFRDELCVFMVKNREELSKIVGEFVEAKRAAKIELDESIEHYKPKFLYKHFNKVNKKIENLREKLPSDLNFKKLFEEEDIVEEIKV